MPIVFELVDMLPDDIEVVTDGRTCLCLQRRTLMEFGDGLVDEREHDRERDSVLSEEVIGNGSTVVSEIAAEDSREMEDFAFVTIDMINLVGDGTCHDVEELFIVGMTRLDKDWYVCKIDNALL